MARFGSVVTAMVTPFHPDGDIDLDMAGQVARHLAATGSEALVVAGTTGEGPVLTDAERLDLFRAVVEVVDVPVIASTGTNDTAHSVLLTREAKACGASGVLAVTPYYNRPSAAGLSAHFRAVAAATDLPVVLYDIPYGRAGGSAPSSSSSWPETSRPSSGSRTPPETWRERPPSWRRVPRVSMSTAGTTH